jgi:hypothetical protein
MDLTTRERWSSTPSRSKTSGDLQGEGLRGNDLEELVYMSGGGRGTSMDRKYLEILH